VGKIHAQFDDELHILVVIETVDKDVEAIRVHGEIRPDIVVPDDDSLLSEPEDVDFESLLLDVKLHTLKEAPQILG